MEHFNSELVVIVEKQGDHSTTVPEGITKCVREYLAKLNMTGRWALQMRGAKIRGWRDINNRGVRPCCLWPYGIEVYVQPGERGTCRRCVLIPPKEVNKQWAFEQMRPNALRRVDELLNQAANDATSLLKAASYSPGNAVELFPNKEVVVDVGRSYDWSNSRVKQLVISLYQDIDKDRGWFGGDALDRAIMLITGCSHQNCLVHRLVLIESRVVAPTAFRDIFVLDDYGNVFYEDVLEEVTNKLRATVEAKIAGLESAVKKALEGNRVFEDSVVRERAKRQQALEELNRELVEQKAFLEELNKT